MKNPYSVLGVDRGADPEEIRKAYKKLARKYHPDVNKDPGAEDRFKEINAAYEVVGDADKRKLYDEFGDVSLRSGFDADQARAWQAAGAGHGAPFDFGGFGGGMGGGVDVEDLLGSLFGAGVRGARQQRGYDQTTTISVDFMTTVLGGERQIRVQRPDGRAETIRVPIPAGAKDGGKVRLKGQGAPPRGGGPCGDLIVELKVGDHPVLRRSGDDLEMDVPITVLEALSGGSITVPTPTGDVKVTIPAGARSGTRLRIKDRGIQKAGRPGHLYLLLRPTVPDAPTPELIDAAKALEVGYGDVRAELKL